MRKFFRLHSEEGSEILVDPAEIAVLEEDTDDDVDVREPEGNVCGTVVVLKSGTELRVAERIEVIQAALKRNEDAVIVDMV